MKLHEHFLGSGLRTRDPDAATLFFVPVYLGRLFNWFWQRPHCGEADAPPPPMCREEQVHTPHCTPAGTRSQRYYKDSTELTERVASDRT